MKRAAIFALSFSMTLAMMGPAFAEKMHHSSVMPDTMESSSMMNPMAPELKLIKTLKGEDSFSIVRPAFSRDGRYVAANLNEPKSIRVWNVQTGEVVSDISSTLLYGPNQLVDGLEFLPNNHIVVFRAGFPIKEIDFQNRSVVRSIDLGIKGPKIEDYAFTPDQHWLVLATPTGIDLIDYTKGVRVSRILEDQYINSLDVSKDGRWVAFAKRGPIQEAVGLVDLNTKTVSKYPLAHVPEEQQSMLPNYQVRHVSFDPSGRNLMIGYMALPEGQFKPTGPAGVISVNIETSRIVGPRMLSSDMISFDPIMLGKFNATIFNTFEMGMDRATSATDFISPDLSMMKTMTDSDLNAPMLTFRVSPDQRWLVGSFKEPDGKVRVRLYEITPGQSMMMEPSVH